MQIFHYKRYLRFSINFSSKCFSHTCSLRSLIWRLKSASMTRFLVIWFTHCSRVFLDNSSSPLGILKILIPECLRDVEHPKMLQLAPGMTVNGHTKRKCFKKQEDPILFHTMKGSLCTFAVTSEAIKENNNIFCHVTQPS